MPARNSKSRKSKPANGFRISSGPVIRLPEENDDFSAGLAVPRHQGEPILFATARDPHTIFSYWDVDWVSLFAQGAPVDRQVHLRVLREDGSEEISAAVEPMAGNFYLSVSEPEGIYRVEIGYYQPEEVWHSVVTSENVTMPAEGISDDLDVDVATIPFHLSFQRLIDMFRASSGDPLTEIISRLQRRAVGIEGGAGRPTPEEGELLRAMNLSFEEIDSARAGFTGGAKDKLLRKRTEAILGFGSTSPSRGFGPSSWA